MATTSNVFESYQLQDGTMIYKVNGVKVSKSQYMQQQTLAKEKEKLFKLKGEKEQENQLSEGKKFRESLLGITDEKRKTETQDERMKRLQDELSKISGNKEGGLVKKKKTKKTKKTNSRSIAKKYFKGIF